MIKSTWDQLSPEAQEKLDQYEYIERLNMGVSFPLVPSYMHDTLARHGIVTVNNDNRNVFQLSASNTTTASPMTPAAQEGSNNQLTTQDGSNSQPTTNN